MRVRGGSPEESLAAVPWLGQPLAGDEWCISALTVAAGAPACTAVLESAP